MIRLLERAAESSPDQLAVVTSEGSTSYGELLDDARRVAFALQQRKITRFAIVEPDASWVIRLLAGAALVGAEPCQYQADIPVPELIAQAAVLRHSVVVGRRADLPDELQVIRPQELLTTEAPPERTTASEAQPFLIRTTGTTGQPKAVRHDWQRLARTVEEIRPRPHQRWLLAYGPHQFAGVQVLQHVVACQATLVAPFPRQPRDGLEALLTGEVTCVSATPTYWRFLLAEARSRGVTLPCLEQVTLGGEASSADLLHELKHAFPKANISQVYASTEFGSVASVKDGLPGLRADALFSETNPTSNLQVTDGELWVREGAGLGYADEADPVSPESSSDGWRPTGDLVEVVDGRVVFRGRTSEVINVGGVKVHPLPVENRITALESVALARVFGRSSSLTGAIVAVEVVPTRGLAHADLESIRHEIKAAVADLPRAWHPRSITFVEVFETRGEKTIRTAEA